MKTGPSDFPAHGKCIEHDSQILNAVILIKIEDQDDIVLELRAVGAPPSSKNRTAAVQDCPHHGRSS
jgi:hypothetical protein